MGTFCFESFHEIFVETHYCYGGFEFYSHQATVRDGARDTVAVELHAIGPRENAQNEIFSNNLNGQRWKQSFEKDLKCWIGSLDMKSI